MQTTDSAQPEPSRKIVIFYSSIGHGHIRAAQGIQQEINRAAPDARVILQDIREFMHPLWRRVDERLYWFIVDNLPETFDAIFHALQLRGNRVPSLAWLPNDYPQDKVRAFLEAQSPDCVIATHYGSAQVLGSLREQGLLTHVRIGWLHTDFFEGYFPRISKRIDCTFLAHPELALRWIAAGVAPDKLVTSGMPIAETSHCDGGTSDVPSKIPELDPSVPIALITSGKQGVGDYAAVVSALALQHSGPLQVIAVCGLNTRLVTRLEALQSHLPENVALTILGLVSHSDLLACMRAADVLITKAGGMTPTEAIAIGIPVILLDVVRGHESENAAFLVRLGVAELAADPAHAGELAATLLSDDLRRITMLRAQETFQQNANMGLIAHFALTPSPPAHAVPPDFGAERGTAIADIGPALTQLETESPCDLELLLSYSTAHTPQRIVLDNPFGHLAIRIGDTVYSANHIAQPEHTPNFLQHLSLADYLYGVQPPSPRQVHTNTYGMAYGRETLGLRVRGVRKQRKEAMLAEARRIEDEFRQGTLHWHRSQLNCADIVVRIAGAGGYHRSPPMGREWLPAMPLDVFDEARQVLESDPSLQMELVAYRQIPGAKATYRFSRFPLSLGQPLRSIMRTLRGSVPDPLEISVSKQLTGYHGDQGLHFEDLHARGIGDRGADVSLWQRHVIARALAADLRRLLASSARRPLHAIEGLADLSRLHDIQCLLDRSLSMARIATEQADEMLQERAARKFRLLFSELVERYGKIGMRSMHHREIAAYLELFSVFEAIVARTLPTIRKAPRVPHRLPNLPREDSNKKE